MTVTNSCKPQVRWSPKFLDPRARVRAENFPMRGYKHRMTLEEHQVRMAQFQRAKQLVGDSQELLDTARHIIKQRWHDSRKKIACAYTKLNQCEHTLDQLREMEIDPLVRSFLPSCEELRRMLEQEVHKLAEMEWGLNARAERKRRQREKHAKNKKARAETNRLAATGSTVSRKNGK